MKRFLLSGLMLLATARMAFCYENDAVVQVPTMNPELIQIDDPLFINNGSFTVSIPQILGAATSPYETSSTLNYTNTGTMIGIPGFDFETFPVAVGQAHLADSFVNYANGPSGGEITAINAFGGLNVFQQGGLFGALFPLNFDISGLATIKVRATNVIDSGLITLDNTGLIDILGNSVDLRHGRFVMTGEPTVISSDSGSGGFGTNSSGWLPSAQLTPVSASSPIFTNSAGLIEQFSVFNSTAYFENTDPQPGPDGIAVWRIIFLADSSPTNVTHSVFFDSSIFGNGAFHIQWAGTYRDPRTGQQSTNFFLLSDVPEIRRNPGGLNIFNGVPVEFSFASAFTPFFNGTGVAPGFVSTPFPGAVTNDFAFLSGIPQPLSLGTNQVVGGSPTNLPGRIQLSSLGSLNLADTTISGPNYLRLNSPVNFLGNSNSLINAPYSDLNLGVTNGSLTISNLLVPNLPAWTGSGGGAFGGFFGSAGIQAFSGSYFFVSSNTPAGSTNTIIVTNDVRILIVSSDLQPTTPALSQTVTLHAPDSLQINDQMTIFGNFSSDTTSLTVATNASSAYSPYGTLLLTWQDFLWGASLPNLQYLTNWGIITTTNLANFAGNMPGLLSPRSQATAYQAFVNHGLIANQGIFVKANYFENSGSLQENQFGGIALSIGNTATSTNSTITASNGPISIAANSLLLSNSVVYSGRTLTFNTPCFLSDGYAFGNQFGHITNTTPLNVVTNGNAITTAGGVQVLTKPASGDLLGTTITDISLNSLLSMNVWSGEDRGCSPAGFAENTALGRLIFTSDASPSHFVFQGLNNNNALYVDSIEFQNDATNTDLNGNFTAITIQPGMKIYYAQALMNGVSVAEKLNGKNGGGFCWVSNYAGVYSSTNLSYPDGNSHIFNQALVISPNLDSDGDGTVNRDDPTPIPSGLTFDVSNAGPQPCGGGNGGGGGGGGNGDGGGSGSQHTPGTLTFPQQKTGSGGGVSFALAQGSYNGLFYETNGVKPSTSGFFTAKLNGKGTFSAKIQLGNSTYSFTAAFDANGDVTIPAATGKKPLPFTVTLHLVNNDHITGQVSGNGWTAQLLAFNSVKNATMFGAGKHSLVLSVNETNSTTTDSGDSFGAMTLSKNGSIQWSGVLSDGGKVSQKSALSQNGVWPLYSSTYGGNGSLIGWLQLTNGTSDIGGSAIWIVPANQNSLYPNGVTNELDATGSELATPPAGTQKTIILTGPQLASPLTNSVTISGKTGKNGDNSLTLSIDAKNGLFSGSVVDPNSSQKLSFQGALLEKSGMGGGFFLNANKNQGGKVYLVPAN